MKKITHNFSSGVKENLHLRYEKSWTLILIYRVALPYDNIVEFIRSKKCGSKDAVSHGPL